MMREVLRTITAILAAIVECAGKRSECLMVKFKRLREELKPNRLEGVLIVLALSMIAVWLFLPGESTAIIGYLVGL